MERIASLKTRIAEILFEYKTVAALLADEEALKERLWGELVVHAIELLPPTHKDKCKCGFELDWTLDPFGMNAECPTCKKFYRGKPSFNSPT